MSTSKSAERLSMNRISLRCSPAAGGLSRDIGTVCDADSACVGPLLGIPRCTRRARCKAIPHENEPPTSVRAATLAAPMPEATERAALILLLRRGKRPWHEYADLVEDRKSVV